MSQHGFRGQATVQARRDPPGGRPLKGLVDWDTLGTQQFDQSIPTKIFGSDSNYFNNNYYPPTFVKKNADSLKALGMRVHMADNPGDVTMGPRKAYRQNGMIRFLQARATTRFAV